MYGFISPSLSRSDFYTYMAVLKFLRQTVCISFVDSLEQSFSLWNMDLKLDNCHFRHVLATNSAVCTRCHGSTVWWNGSTPSRVSFFDVTPHFALLILRFILVFISQVQTKGGYIISPTLCMGILLPMCLLHLKASQYALWLSDLRLVSCGGLFYQNHDSERMQAMLPKHFNVVMGISAKNRCSFLFLKSLFPSQSYSSACCVKFCGHETSSK